MADVSIIDIQMNGDEAYMALLNLNSTNIRQAIADGIDKTVEMGAVMIAEACPVKFGGLKASILARHASLENLDGAIFSNLEYAPFVEFGTGIYSENPLSNKQPFKITAKNGKALKFAVGGNTIFRRSVVIQGMHPAAMFRSNIPAIQELLEENIKKYTFRFISGGATNG